MADTPLWPLTLTALPFVLLDFGYFADFVTLVKALPSLKVPIELIHAIVSSAIKAVAFVDPREAFKLYQAKLPIDPVRT